MPTAEEGVDIAFRLLECTEEERILQLEITDLKHKRTGLRLVANAMQTTTAEAHARGSGSSGSSGHHEADNSPSMREHLKRSMSLDSGTSSEEVKEKHKRQRQEKHKLVNTNQSMRELLGRLKAEEATLVTLVDEKKEETMKMITFKKAKMKEMDEESELRATLHAKRMTEIEKVRGKIEYSCKLAVERYAITSANKRIRVLAEQRKRLTQLNPQPPAVQPPADADASLAYDTPHASPSGGGDYT
jgi:hypothetical protein